MPRHPPCALNTNTQHAHNTKNKKSKNKDKKHNTTPTTSRHNAMSMFASTIQFSHNTTPTQEAQGTKRYTRCPRHPTTHQQTPPTTIFQLPHTPWQTHNPTQNIPMQKNNHHVPAAIHPETKTTQQPQPAAAQNKLLRKEVIQPHLPVRLPCYDFVPIADPTFDHSLPNRG